MNDQHRARLERIAQARADLAQRKAQRPDLVDHFEMRMARLNAARKRERERFDHLVIGKPRPTETIVEGKKKGRLRPKKVEVPVKLSPGIEEAVQIRELHGYWKGTPETLAAAERTHQGALVQLHRNGTINNEQLEYAAQIANVHRSIEADVAVKVASLEARVDNSARSPVVGERIHRVRMHHAYGLWRHMLPSPPALVLDMIVGDAIGYSVAASRHRVHKRKAKRLLIEAIDRWPLCVAHAFTVVDQAMVDAMNEARRPSTYQAPRPPLAVEYTSAREDERGHERTDEPYLLPPIDPAFLDDRGLLRSWEDIADIIRLRVADLVASEAA